MCSIFVPREHPSFPASFSSLGHRMELHPSEKIKIPFQVSRKKLVATLNLSSADWLGELWQAALKMVSKDPAKRQIPASWNSCPWVTPPLGYGLGLGIYFQQNTASDGMPLLTLAKRLDF